MNAYFVNYPRNFGNEYEVYAIESGRAGELAAIDGMERISRADAIRLGWNRPREAKKDGEQWFGGFAQTRGYAETLDEALIECVQATEAMLNTRAAIVEMG